MSHMHSHQRRRPRLLGCIQPKRVCHAADTYQTHAGGGGGGDDVVDDDGDGDDDDDDDDDDGGGSYGDDEG